MLAYDISLAIESQAQPSEQGYSPSAVHVNECTDDVVLMLVAIDGTYCNVADDLAGGIDFLDRHFVPSGHCLLTSPTSPVFVEVSCLF